MLVLYVILQQQQPKPQHIKSQSLPFLRFKTATTSNISAEIPFYRSLERGTHIITRRYFFDEIVAYER